ncbi:T9SS type A sorting domain-containing protein, partial [Marinoscillum furvescens]|uniref:T9SS type A sorting domain-containing protein n=1 Tax=Marinoscillum furvescens TaxID=1026 RepID=UPI001476366A
YQVGSNAYQPADPVTQVLQVKKEQVITFEALPVKSVGDEPFDPGATVSSGLPITYTSSDADVAEIIDGKIHLKGSGVVTITASQPGDDLYFAADEVAQNMAVLGGNVLSLSNQATVYPNPTQGLVYIPNNDFSEFVLFALDGRVLLKGSLEANQSGKVLDLSAQQEGVYFLQLSGKSLTKTLKILKQKPE